MSQQFDPYSNLNFTVDENGQWFAWEDQGQVYSMGDQGELFPIDSLPQARNQNGSRSRRSRRSRSRSPDQIPRDLKMIHATVVFAMNHMRGRYVFEYDIGQFVNWLNKIYQKIPRREQYTTIFSDTILQTFENIQLFLDQFSIYYDGLFPIGWTYIRKVFIATLKQNLKSMS